MLPPYFADPCFVASSQKYWFRGIILAAIGYGVNFTLFILCANLLRHHISSRRGDVTGVPNRMRYRWDIFSLCYTTLLFILATVGIVLEAIVSERAFLQSGIFPAGPSIYLFDNVFGHVTILWPVYIAHISSHLLATGLLAWRCLTIYRASLGDLLVYSRVPIWVVIMILPLCLYGASAGTGILFIIDTTAPWKLPPVLAGLPWIIIWGIMSVALWWILTGLIVHRLLTYHCITQRTLGEWRHIQYGRLIALFVGSAGVTSVFYVFFIVVVSRKSPMLTVVLFPLTQVQVLSALLNMYGVTSGKGSSTEDANRNLPMLTFVDVPGEPT